MEDFWKVIDADECGVQLLRGGSERYFHFALRLVDGSIRRIGALHTHYITKRKIFYKTVKQGNLFEKADAIGFCERVIEYADPDEVRIFYKGDDKHKPGFYFVPKAEYVLNKTYLHFKAQGFEKQVFIPMEVMRYEP